MCEDGGLDVTFSMNAKVDIQIKATYALNNAVLEEQ